MSITISIGLAVGAVNNNAVVVEENENKIAALVGLAMCQHLLGDSYNVSVTFHRIDGVCLTRSQVVH